MDQSTTDALIETLADPQRLALAYDRGESRARMLALLALDMRLAGIVRAAREPVIAQMKLAWWRDRLAQNPAEWPVGEPLLARLANIDEVGGLAPLVDGWEALLGERLDSETIEAFAAGRAALFAVASHPDLREPAWHAGRQWALADLAANLGDEVERSRVVAARPAKRPSLVGLPRPLRILSALGGRGLERGGRPLLEGPGALATLLRAAWLAR